jgi:hemoglobin
MSQSDDSVMTTDDVPTLYQWIGGASAIELLVGELYRRVPKDPLLAPVFAQMGPEHVTHVSAFIAEVLGGPKTYSEQRGGHPHMVQRHMGRALTEAQRKRWMDLLLACADDVGIPSDPEFRSALVAYLEWGSRLAVINSQPDATPGPDQPMPRWGWGETKGPYRP